MTGIAFHRSAAFATSRRFILRTAVVGVMTFASSGPLDAQSLGYASLQTISAPSSNFSTRESVYGRDALVAEDLQRTIVAYDTREAPGTIVIDTGNTYLYYVLGQGRAIRYGVGVGREGFTWSGVQTVSRKAEWPDWIPPAEMIARQPYLPRWIGGGPGNPLGARAMYLGGSIYRIHGTNDPSTIGQFVSSGCIRMTNEDVIDLFRRVNIGTKVVVLPKMKRRNLDAYAAMPARAMTVTGSRQLSPRSGGAGLR
ncbi:L,D-transpeptidase [Bradyrhizobium sp. LHD-71]|uniref:L,D-transpeptidase n=1 Tax=Bradyrhizobium sp. LHD-71 TaxID=3072141 RepID=UPI00280D9073|nr:L,D-transpeptidase [Bradyrhizobium sp. LHD-71]MDQ8727041.1 L,D-transpeptidase [Bradyrhizobium sp. LHD-71]